MPKGNRKPHPPSPQIQRRIAALFTRPKDPYRITAPIDPTTRHRAKRDGWEDDDSMRHGAGEGQAPGFEYNDF